MSQSKAQLSFLRIAPRKVRLVTDAIRGLKIEQALNQLRFVNRAAAKPLLKLLNSAVANADMKGNIDIDNLYIKSLLVNAGPIIKRFRPRARGSAFRINKRTSHVTVILEEK